MGHRGQSTVPSGDTQPEPNVHGYIDTLHDKDVEEVMSRIEPLILAKVKSLIPEAWRSVTAHGRQPLNAPRGDKGSNITTVIVLVHIGAKSVRGLVEDQFRRVVEDVTPYNMNISLEILPSNFVG